MTGPRRAVITGAAPISAVGIGREDFWEGIAQGREGRRPPEKVAGDFPNVRLVAECLDFFVEDYLESEKTYLDRCSELVLAACALCFEDAGLDWEAFDHPRAGLALGTAFGCLESMDNVTARVQSKGVRFASPMIFTHCFANSPVSLAAIEYRLQGPVAAICAGDQSSASALQYALDLVRWNRADVVLAGGADALSGPLMSALNLSALQGRAPGEGACLLAIEGLEEARERGANILAELVEVTLGEELAQPQATPVFEAPDTYGHTFGAGSAMDVAAALAALPQRPGKITVATTTDDGATSAITIERCE